MIFRKLYINIIVRVILLVLTAFLLPFVVSKYDDFIITANVLVLLILQIVLLIRYLNFINRDLSLFFDSVKYDDTSIVIKNKKQNKNYYRLIKRLNEVNKQIYKLKRSITSQEQYFRTVTEHTGTGLLGYNTEGKILLCNKAARDLLMMDDVSNIKKLDAFYPQFSDILAEIKPSEQKLLEIRMHYKGNIQLLIKATRFKSAKGELMLVSLQDIKYQLDEKELQAWQKMVQILRHEIMNSVGSISSTIDTLNELLINPENHKSYDIEQLNNEILEDIATGLKLVKERNTGIQDFVQKFRAISKLPNPEMTQVSVTDLINHISLLWKNELDKKNILFKVNIQHGIKFIHADKNLLGQVLINLIKNSVEALENKDKKEIILEVIENATGKTNINLTDNGRGIEKEMLRDIFLPFFTTKKEGSGIGLSLSRQIMRLHGGNINVVSVPNQKTTFTLSF